MPPGNYTFKLVIDPDATVLEDTVADNTLSLAHTISAQVVLTAPALYLRLNANGLTLDIWNNTSPTGVPDQTFTASQLSLLSAAGAVAQNVTIDFSLGNPLPTSGFTFTGAVGAANKLTIVGTGGIDQYTMTGNTININSASILANILRTNVNDVAYQSLGANDLITLNYASGNPLPAKLKLDGIFTLNGFQNFNNTTLDLSTSTLLISYAPGNSVAATIRQYLARGYNGGGWNGLATPTAGAINSSSAGVGTNRAIGYADFGDGRDVNLTPNSVLLKFTHQADTDLNGNIDFVDLLRLAQNYGQSSLVWDQGDLDYDNIVDFNDLLRLAQGYGQSLTMATAPIVSRTEFSRHFSSSVVKQLDDLKVFSTNRR